MVIMIFVSSGRFLIQGKLYEEWSSNEFPILLQLINSIQPSERSQTSADVNTLCASSMSSFFTNFIYFASADTIPDIKATKSTPTVTPVEPNTKLTPLLLTPSCLHTIATLRNTVGTLEADFMQVKMVVSGDTQELKDKIVQQDNHLNCIRRSPTTLLMTWRYTSKLSTGN